MRDSVYSNWSAIWDFVTTSVVFVEDRYNTDRAIKLFPNPATKEITISFYLEREMEEVNISVFDVLGRSVSEIEGGRCSAGAHIVKIPKINIPGIYFVQIEIDDRLFVTKLIVKRNDISSP